MSVRVSKKAVISLAVGLVGLIPSPFTPFAFLLAILFGNKALKEIDSYHGELRGRIAAKSGRYIGIAGVIFILFALTLFSGM
jgi:hypothetical protein